MPICGIDRWLIRRGVEPGNTIAGTARLEGSILEVTWDVLVSLGELWMGLPSEYMFALVEYYSIYELEKIVNRLLGIPVFHGHYRYEALASFSRKCSS